MIPLVETGDNERAARLGEKRFAAFLAARAYCGRKSPAELLARLRAAAAGLAGEAEAEARGELVRTLVEVLAPLVAQIAELSARIRHAVAELPDGRLVMSLPRADRVCAASARSPTSPADPAAPASDGPATAACAPPSPASPTTPATLRPGPPASTPTRAPEDGRAAHQCERAALSR